MKFGVREICNVVFKALSTVTIGGIQYPAGAPVLYIDSAKTSTVEGAATTVYAQGGRGNARLIAWEGDKTLTFTVEDALLSPVSFAMLSGAGLLKGKSTEKVHVHMTSMATATTGKVDLTNLLGNDEICTNASIFVIPMKDGDFVGAPVGGTSTDGKTITGDGIVAGEVFVDYYVMKTADKVSELQIDAANFAGNYYVEADTLFRRQADSVDLPAQLTFPNVKIQSNFTFSMAATGEPSTFTFTMDALPGYTHFNKNRKVLCAMQIVEDGEAADAALESVFPCAHGTEGN